MVAALLGPVASARTVTTLQSVRFDAGADKYSRSATGLGATDLTMCCWVKIVVDRNALSVILAIDNAASLYTFLATTADGTSIRLDGAGGAQGMVAATVGTWYFIGYTHTNASTATKVVYYAAQGAGSLTAGAPFTNNVALTDACSFYIGGDGFGSTDFLNGSVAQVRVWSALLNSTEMNAEFHSRTPVRTSNLWAAYSFASGPQTTDDSGNGRTLTAAGTLVADAAGPTIT